MLSVKEGMNKDVIYTYKDVISRLIDTYIIFIDEKEENPTAYSNMDSMLEGIICREIS